MEHRGPQAEGITLVTSRNLVIAPPKRGANVWPPAPNTVGAKRYSMASAPQAADRSILGSSQQDLPTFASPGPPGLTIEPTPTLRTLRTKRAPAASPLALFATPKAIRGVEDRAVQASELDFHTAAPCTLTLDRFPVYPHLDFQMLNRKALQDIQKELVERRARKKVYQRQLKGLAHEIVHLQATELEAKEQLLTRGSGEPRTPNSLNSYSVQQLGQLPVAEGSKPIRFIGQRHLLSKLTIDNGLQQGKTLGLIRLP